MFRRSVLVFDAFIPNSSTVNVSGDQFADLLGAHDSHAVFVVVDEQNASGTITVAYEHSGNGGMDWVQTGDPAISSASVPSSGTFPAWGDAHGLPFLAYVRVRITFGGGLTSARVRVYASLRDGVDPFPTSTRSRKEVPIARPESANLR